MNSSEKIKIILQLSRFSQWVLAQKLDTSPQTLSSWLHGKSLPRKKAEEKISQLYLLYTGQNIIPTSVIEAKKIYIQQSSQKYSSILEYILKRRDLYEHFLVSLTYHTNSIEWSTLSENETAQILLENTSIASKTLIEQLEAKNHQSALQYLFRYLQESSNIINEELILKLHSILMNSIQDDAWCYRRHWVRILGSQVITANYLKVPQHMQELCQDIKNDSRDTISQVAKIHAQFEKVHPFSDGNGRIGRLLMHAMLLRNNIPPVLIKQQEKQIYYTVLSKAQTSPDSSLLEDFILDSLLYSFEILDQE